jgi:hypothetical protein
MPFASDANLVVGTQDVSIPMYNLMQLVDVKGSPRALCYAAE